MCDVNDVSTNEGSDLQSLYQSVIDAAGVAVELQRNALNAANNLATIQQEALGAMCEFYQRQEKYGEAVMAFKASREPIAISHEKAKELLNDVNAKLAEVIATLGGTQDCCSDCEPFHCQD